MHIQIEGCEASGKTTLINNLKTYYQNLNYNVTTEHFPRSDHSPFGELARKLLDSKYEYKHVDLYITLLSIADQKLYSEQFDYTSTNLFIQSRGILSTLVYTDLHHAYKSIRTQKILNLLDLIPTPDIILYLKPELSLVKNRLVARSYSNIYDQISLVETILERYDSMINYLSSRVNIITIPFSGEQPSGYVLNKTKEHLNTILKNENHSYCS